MKSSLEITYAKKTVKRKAKAKKPKKVRYRKCKFSISEQEYKKMELYCKANGITPNKLVKNVVRAYLKEHGVKVTESHAKNQLDLFKPSIPIQITMNL